MLSSSQNRRGLFGGRGACAAALLAAAGGLGTASAALGAITVIYSKKPGHPTATVPGAVALDGSPAATEFRGIEKLVISPDGSRWILQGRTTQSDRSDVVLIAGQGTSGSVLTLGGFTFHEGQPAPLTGTTTDGFIDFFQSGLGSFDEQNRLVFGLRARTVANYTTSTSVSSTAGQRALVWDGTTLSVPLKQTDLYTGLQDTGTSGDERVGNSVGSFHLLSDLRVGAHDPNPASLSSTRYPVLSYDKVGFQQRGVGSLTGLGGSGTAVWAALDSNAFYTTPSNSAWIASGTALINGGTTAQAVLVRNGTVVLQQDQPVAPGGPNLGAISQHEMMPNGRWVARGRDNSSTASTAPDWAVRDGALIAKSGDPITPGSTELWGDTFSTVMVNRNGDYLIVGNTSNADAGKNEVGVLNGTTVVFREGDPIDLDGNGQFDDNAWIGRGTNTLAAFTASNQDGPAFWLTDDRTIYGLINLRDGEVSGNDINVVPAFGASTAFVRVTTTTPPPACRADFDNSGTRTIDDIFVFLNAWFAGCTGQAGAPCNGLNADIDGLNGRTIDDIFIFLNLWFAGCPTP